ncbi:MAG: PQQ-binding-like beta-propeller repeat protein [Candidatus Sumerlaeota bacterium]|nr:PQQ-binding-like beta-propeller repeat protein [Candidatus Sumerlaeota bacterium]
MRIYTQIICLMAALAAFASCSKEDNAAGGAAAKPSASEDLSVIHVSEDDWPWWRDAQHDNVSKGAQEPPLRWSETENILWKTPIPGLGHGTPCLWGNRIFLPTANEKAMTQSMLCLDRKSGKILWQKQVHRGEFVDKNPRNSHASSSPACDGVYVYAVFANHKAVWLSALDFSGRIAWQTRLGDYYSKWGLAASPVIYQSRVIVMGDGLQDSFVAAAHRRTGEIVWKTARPSFTEGGTYATPTLGRVAGRDQLLVHGPDKIFSYDPLGGGVIWTCDGPSAAAVATMAFDEELAYATGGYPQLNTMAVRANGAGDVSTAGVVWKSEKISAYVPSLLLKDGLLYVMSDAGRLTSFESKTGARVYDEQFKGPFGASPVWANGRIYAANDSGRVYVFKAGRQFQLFEANDLMDRSYATPVICGGHIYLRTFRSLYCIGKR